MARGPGDDDRQTRIARTTRASARQAAPRDVVVMQGQSDCLRLLLHCNLRAASRAACTAGNNNAIKMPMIVMTTSNSTSVKPVFRNVQFIRRPLGRNSTAEGAKDAEKRLTKFVRQSTLLERRASTARTRLLFSIHYLLITIH